MASINLSELASQSHSKPHPPREKTSSVESLETQSEPIIVRHHRDGHPESPFFVFTYPGMAEKYRKDPNIPLLNVVEKFKVYIGNGRSQAEFPARGDLLSEFGTDNVEEIINVILLTGKLQKDPIHIRNGFQT